MATAAIVETCNAVECAYNEDKKCRALAITVGEPSAATCETFTPKKAEKAGFEMTVANVGACKASACKHNENLTCKAKEVKIDVDGSNVRCMTFDPA